MKIGQEFIHRKTGRKVKIVEIKPTMEGKGRKAKLVTRYRLSSTDEYYTADQVRTLYGEAVQTETIKA